MKYMGSKNRIAKQLLPIILEGRTDDQWYIEPFVGGANMIDKVEGKRMGSDMNEYVIALLNEMCKDDFEAPEIDEVKYGEIKSNKDDHPLWVVGYAGTQLTFGSTWFGSYRRDRQPDSKRNYCLEARNNVNKQSVKVKGIIFKNKSYSDLNIPDNSIIYCDPPYDTKATKGKYSTIGFNHDEFWDWCRDRSKEGNKVYISEYNAPEDFKCIWSKEMGQRMNNSVNTSKTTEKLFIYNPI